LGNASLLWTGMRAGEFGAAWFLDGLEFHEFDPGIVGVVDVELPFAVAADFGRLGEFDAGFRDLVGDDVDVRDAERDVVHDAARMLIGIGRNIEHVLDPIGAFGDLHGDPVVSFFRHAAMPVRTEAEFIYKVAIGGLAIVNDEACMNDANGVGGICRRQAGIHVFRVGQVIGVRN
jgi:hypothetical protein